MDCHEFAIKKDWLIENEENYDFLLLDAFEMLILTQKQQNPDSNIKQDPKDDPQYIQDRLKQLHDPELNPKEDSIFLEYCLDEEQEEHNQIFPIFKKGHYFSGIQERLAMIEEDRVVQVIRKIIINKSKNKEPEEVEDISIVKDFGNPIDMNIEVYDEKEQFQIPWDKNQLQEELHARLTLIFEAHSPIWIYYPTYEDAARWRDFLIKQRVQKNMENIVHDFPQWTFEIKLQYAEKFQRLLQLEAEDTNRKNKMAAALKDKDRKFLESVEANIIIYVAKQWAKKSQQKYKEDQIKQKKEREQQLLLQQQQSKQQDKKKNIQNFILSKKHLFDDRIKDLIHIFLSSWLNQSKAKKDEIKQLTFIITFRSINIEESLQIVKPNIEVTFQSRIADLGQDVKKKDSQKKDFSYFRLKLSASLKQQKTENFLNWELSEKCFENQTGLLKMGSEDRQYASIKISNVQQDDALYFSFADTVQVFAETTCEIQDILISELFENASQGRSIWLPIVIHSKKKGVNNAEQINSFALLEIDLLKLPSFLDPLDPYPATFEDEFEQIVKQNLPIIDPIYQATIKLPTLDEDILKVLLKIIESNTPLLKDSIGMMGYMMFVGNSQIENDQTNPYFEIKKFAFRKIIENTCHFFTNYNYQLEQWEILRQFLKQHLEFTQQTHKTIDAEFLYKTMRERVNDEKLWNQYRNFAIAGIPVYMRPTFWFHLLKGPIHLAEIKKFAKTKFDILPEERFQNQDDKTSKIPYEYSWLYYKLNEQVNSIPPQKTKLMMNFLNYQSQLNNFSDETFLKQLQRVLLTFILIVDQLYNLTMNPFSIQNLFLIGQKLLSLANYHYIEFNKNSRWALVEDTRLKYLDDLKLGSDSMIREIENESFAFWLLICFFKNVVQDYPFFANVNRNALLQDCAHLNTYLVKEQSNTQDFMKIYEIKVETILSEVFMNLYSDLFASEALFRIWDIILFGILKEQNQDRPYIIPAILGALISRVSTKLKFIFSQSQFLNALKLEAKLISDINSFIKEVLQTEEQVMEAVDQMLQEEGHLPKDTKADLICKDGERFFDLQKYQQLDPSSVMSIHEYLEYNDMQQI